MFNPRLQQWSHLIRSRFGRSISRFNKESRDTGSWKINQDSQYCRTWDNWRDGSEVCYQVFSLEGGKLRMKAIGKRQDIVFALQQGDSEGLVE